MQRLARVRILEPEDPSTISPFEQRIRKILAFAYRISVSIFATIHLFDFLFSSVWMHGYIWSLNLPIDLDMSDKSAGAIVYHQLEQVGNRERLCLMAAKVLAITTLLIFSGFASGKPQNVWKLFQLSTCVGVLAGFVRALQLKQRLFSSLHEGFYCYLITFVVGLILTLKPLERLPTSKSSPQQKMTAEHMPAEQVEENNNDVTQGGEKKENNNY
ncbi:unnamed protein product [Cylicocyclus nassatus]|uniref:Uncharacterized protein n=1 Tax=Cylicocyclus nassatus TaxID=53992 RepID=A0AA36MDN1_CYLNA|nr:unnamed protein product [Cylicocyclus nassatus]